MHTWTTLDIGRMLVAAFSASMNPYTHIESREARAYRQGFAAAIQTLAIAFDLPQVAATMSEALNPSTVTTCYYFLDDS